MADGRHTLAGMACKVAVPPLPLVVGRAQARGVGWLFAGWGGAGHGLALTVLANSQASAAVRFP